ncbi:MAG TPA: hypothetical protein VGF20_11665 [Candidatus Acidoferrum sp.]|jgi:hypothetical protein
MKYSELFTPYHIATLSDWLEEKGELCLEIYIPHGGASSSLFTFRSLREIKQQIDEIITGEIEITIWKHHTQTEFESEEPATSDTNFLQTLKWKYEHRDEVMYFSVKKNRNYSLDYAASPEKYSKALAEWSK